MCVSLRGQNPYAGFSAFNIHIVHRPSHRFGSVPLTSELLDCFLHGRADRATVSDTGATQLDPTCSNYA